MNDYIEAMGIKPRVWDDKALSVEELIALTGKSSEGVRKMAGERIEAKEWELVWKRSKKNGRPIPAYRPSGIRQ